MNVQFDEPTIPVTARSIQRRQGAIERFYISIGLAKDPASAQRAMIITAVIFFAISVYLAFFRGQSASQAAIEAERTQQINDINRPIDRHL